MNKPLGELADIHYGKSPKEVLVESSDIPVFGTGGKYAAASRKQFDGPGIVVPRKGSLGNPQYVDVPFWASDTTYALIPKANVNAKWLYYNLDSFDLTKLNEATGVPSISRDWLSRIEFCVSSDCEQRRIVQILSTLDEAIEQTDKLIAKYQQIKAGLMHDLFTRGVQANGQPRPAQNDNPTRYKQSSFGWIPLEWAETIVQDCGSVVLGRQRSPDQLSGKWTMPYLRVANVFDGFIDYSDILEMDFTPDERKTFSVRKGDILLNEGQSLELVGRCSLFDGEDDEFCFQNTLVRFRCNADHTPLFYRALFKWYLDTGRFIRIAKQTTSVAHLGADRFAKLRCPKVPFDEQQRIAERFSAVQDSLDGEMRYLAKLRQIKLGLTEDLLTGRVRE